MLTMPITIEMPKKTINSISGLLGHVNSGIGLHIRTIIFCPLVFLGANPFEKNMHAHELLTPLSKPEGGRDH